MAILLAALSSLVYGTADFTGGSASRRNDGMVVTLLSQCCGLVALAIAVACWSHVTVTAPDMWWGALAGVGGGVGLMFFYPALAAGPMAVVAPSTAVCGAVLALLVGLASGDRPGAIALVGAVLALPAIVLVARRSGTHHQAAPRTIAYALVAGCGFGLFYIGIGQTSRASGLWPLVGARAASIALVGVACLVGRRRIRPAPATMPIIALAGVLDLAANALYQLAATRGLLSIVAVLGSLYPVTTVLLAVALLHERLNRAQMAGVGLAGVAVALIAAGH